MHSLWFSPIWYHINKIANQTDVIMQIELDTLLLQMHSLNAPRRYNLDNLQIHLLYISVYNFSLL